MLSIRKFAVIAVLLLGVFVSNLCAQGMFPQPFTADMSMKTKKGEDMTGKFYVGEHKMRMDMDAHGHEVSMITDPGTKTSYMVMHQQKMYMEMHAGQNPMMMQRGPKMPDLHTFDPNNPCASNPDTTCKNEGSETVNGRSTDKWVFTDKKNGEVTTAWIDKKLHFPVRTTTAGTEMNLTNIQEGAPPASTFEIPSGYHKFDMGGMMGGMPQQ